MTSGTGKVQQLKAGNYEGMPSSVTKQKQQIKEAVDAAKKRKVNLAIPTTISTLHKTES